MLLYMFRLFIPCTNFVFIGCDVVRIEDFAPEGSRSAVDCVDVEL